MFPSSTRAQLVKDVTGRSSLTDCAWVLLIFLGFLFIVQTITTPIDLDHHPIQFSTMPIRNPFAKRPDVQNGLQSYEEGVQPLSQNGTRPAFEKVDTMGSKGSSAMSISSKKSQEPVEYKMSGTRLDPSPRTIL